MQASAAGAGAEIRVATGLCGGSLRGGAPDTSRPLLDHASLTVQHLSPELDELSLGVSRRCDPQRAQGLRHCAPARAATVAAPPACSMQKAPPCAAPDPPSRRPAAMRDIAASCWPSTPGKCCICEGCLAAPARAPSGRGSRADGPVASSSRDVATRGSLLGRLPSGPTSPPPAPPSLLPQCAKLAFRGAFPPQRPSPSNVTAPPRAGKRCATCSRRGFASAASGTDLPPTCKTVG